MSTSIKDYRRTVVAKYLQRDVGAIVQLLKEICAHPQVGELVAIPAGARPNQVMDRLLKEFLAELEKSVGKHTEKRAEFSFFDTAEEIKQTLGPEIAKLYLETVMPDELIQKARFFLSKQTEDPDQQKLSKDVVERYKEEAFRIEKNRKKLFFTLQQFSNFPIKNAVTVIKVMEQLHTLARGDYHYLMIKPLFMKLASIAKDPFAKEDVEQDLRDIKHYEFFYQYLSRGEEPSIAQQVEFWLAVRDLLDAVAYHNVVPEKDLAQLKASLDGVLTHTAAKPLKSPDRILLETLLSQTNEDKQAIVARLAGTFVKEYLEAEKEMAAIQREIMIQLANTAEFLNRYDPHDSGLTDDRREKIRIARERIQGYGSVFDFKAELEAARAKGEIEVERSAFGLAASVEPEQIVGWIDIYSIIFSNTDFIKFAKAEIDLNSIRQTISNLTTYHLVQNLTLLKVQLEKSFAASDEEKGEAFKKFNEALKAKLKTMMGGGKRQDDQSLVNLVENLGFVQNKSLEFLIQDTYKGFQTLVDAFNSVADGAFVKDRDSLMAESRALYDQITNQCLRGLIYTKPLQIHMESEDDAAWARRGSGGGFFAWLFGLFRR